MNYLRFFLATWLLCATSAWADSVYLNNGNHIDGIITKENSNQVIVDIGFGTVTLQKADIIKINRSDKSHRQAQEKDIRLRQFESGRWAPKRSKKLAGLFNNAQTARQKALEAKAEQQSLNAEEQSIDKELPELKKNFQSMSSEMQNRDPNEDISGYNDAIGRTNSIGLKIQSDQLREEEIQKKNKAVGSDAAHYLNSYHLLKDYIDKDGAPLFKHAKLGREAEYYAWIRGETHKMGQDFIEDSITSKNIDNHLIVAALLNGHYHAKLLVDTGASMTLLYAKTAEALQLNPRSALGTMKVGVADGRLVQAQVYKLHSITIGKSQIKNTMVAVVSTPMSGFDGLLGMSFLSHFNMRIDGANKRLILEKLK